MTYASIEQRLKVYKEIDTILNSNYPEPKQEEEFIFLLASMDSGMWDIAEEYYTRNTPQKPYTVEELASVRYTKYDPPKPRTTEDWVEEYQKMQQEEEDYITSTSLTRCISFFPDHDSDEYQDMLERIWDRQDRENNKQ